MDDGRPAARAREPVVAVPDRLTGRALHRPAYAGPCGSTAILRCALATTITVMMIPMIAMISPAIPSMRSPDRPDRQGWRNIPPPGWDDGNWFMAAL